MSLKSELIDHYSRLLCLALVGVLWFFHIRPSVFLGYLLTHGKHVCLETSDQRSNKNVMLPCPLLLLRYRCPSSSGGGYVLSVVVGRRSKLTGAVGEQSHFPPAPVILHSLLRCRMILNAVTTLLQAPHNCEERQPLFNMI